jgi:hypothetical protein
MEHAQRSRTSEGAKSLVAELRQNPGDTSLLNSLTNLASDPESWSHLRNAEVSTLFVDLISEPYTKERTGVSSFIINSSVVTDYLYCHC